MNKNIKMIQIPLILSIVLYGGFYSFSFLSIGVLVLAFFFVKTCKEKSFVFVKNNVTYGVCLLLVSSLISSFFAVDKGMAWIGVLRTLTIVAWVFYLMQFTKEERSKSINILPWVAGGMILVGIIAFLLRGVFPTFFDLFWQAERFGGTFQYSNTCALFLLISLIVLSKKDALSKFDFALFNLLLLGVFLTGSKGGIILLIPVLCYVFKRNLGLFKNGIITITVILMCGAIIAVFSNNFQNLGRIFTVFSNQSTFWGRLLYMKDALPLFLKNPFGIGYMGYSSIQPTIQSGVYTSMFVHNDWLQMGLDYGWMFFATFLALYILQLVKGKQDKSIKLSLLLIGLYGIMEFHFEFFSILMIVFLLYDFPEKDIIYVNAKKVNLCLCTTLIWFVLILYFSVQTTLGYVGKHKQALAMYPYDTQSKIALLKVETDKKTATKLAEEILETNAYVPYAYNVLAYGALMDGRYREALEYKYKVVELKKYNVSEYEDYLEMVGTIQSTSRDINSMKLCSDARYKLQKLVQETKESTSKLAYKLRDKPEFLNTIN